MIFVTVGTNETPFDRILRAVDGVATGEELVVQYGSSSVRPASATCYEQIGYDELVAFVRRASVVVTHAGVGSVLTALANGRQPIVMPRLKRFGEAVDDHQLTFAEQLATEGLVRVVHDADELRDAISLAGERRSIELAPDPRLVDDLRDEIAQALARDAADAVGASA